MLRLGVRPRKTYEGVTIPTLPGKAILPFAQGAFDANGWNHLDKHGRKIGMCGPEDLVLWFGAQLAAHVHEAKGGSFYYRGPCAVAEWHGSVQGPAILQWLYRGTGAPRLLRKLEVARAALEVRYS